MNASLTCKIPDEINGPCLINCLCALFQIDELLSYGINVTVYNGQLDVICSTIGAEAWVKKLKWDGLKNFLSLPRQPLKCGSSKGTKAFVRSYKNLHFYWILGAGHFVSLNIHMPHY
ncbi:Os03g0393700 [Oryza sativa Japonica Group]|uniref:Os03g0393700 protein n=1 Tax=Oryza sativa subsp. japonica TaxID=39947 RepID=C7IZS1_ORYSJ|nr:Os03g0393700 [Oryza sativa Japonica Group]|eukprot:NP_001173456.1 Os03g0393700 [Oryza sativa Japonica Group]